MLPFSCTERLLAAQNPLSLTGRPHQLFADAPPPPIMPSSVQVPPGALVPPPPPPIGITQGLPPPPVAGMGKLIVTDMYPFSVSSAVRESV